MITNTSGIEPKGHYILVRPDAVEKVSKGGIIMANETIDNAERDTTQGLLVAVGPIGWTEFGDGTPWATPGDHVSFGKHAGRFMDGSDGVRYMILNCEDVLAVLG